MSETSKPWASTTPGDAGSYSDDDWSDIWRKLYNTDRTVQGVIPGYSSELAATNPSTNTVRIAAGAALVDGKYYENDANNDVTVPVPASSTRIDRIVARKSWAAQTVRITRVAGAEGGAAPSVTQTDATTWDLPLVQVSITTGTVLSLTDERQFLRYPTRLVDRRQGGTAAQYGYAGTINYRPGLTKTQMGIVTHGGSGAGTVTFPETFSGTPVVFLQGQCTTNAIDQLNISSLGTATFVYWANAAGTVAWQAIGPA